MKPRTETRDNGHKLTALEEEALTKQLLDADKRGCSIRPEFLRGMAQILLRECIRDPTATLGVNWHISLSKVIQYYVHDITGAYHINVRSRRIQML